MAYLSYCESDLATYSCDPCVTREFGRVRSVALIRKDALAALLADPTDPTLWQAGIDAGTIIIIPTTAGSFDPGDPSSLKGYGDIKNYNGPRDQKLTWFDPAYTSNYAFYNGLSGVKSWIPAYRTSSQIHICDTVANISAKNSVDDDIESEVIWTAVATVTSTELPSFHDASALEDIFSCAVAG